MRKQDSQRQAGQSLIIVTFLIVAMLVFAGLILDGGNAYAMRRQAQNAADAGALAGARELANRYVCDAAGSALDDAAIARRINEYSERNDAPDSNNSPGDPTNTNVRRRYIDNDGNEINTAQDIGQVGYVPADAVGVHVAPTLRVPTFFMGLVGLNEITVVAVAEARFGVVKVLDGGAILPVAVHMSLFEDEELDPGDDIIIWSKESPYGVTNGDGSPFTKGGSPQRGWLNLKYVFSGEDPNSRTVDRNHGNNPNDGLRYYCCNDYQSPIYIGGVGDLDGDFINGDPGTRASAIMELDCRVGQTVILPIFDHTYSADYLDGQGFPEPDIGWVTPRNGNGAGLIYHIVGFAACKITDLDQTGNDKYIKTEFTKAVIGGYLDPNDPSDLCGPELKTIGLTR